MGQAKNSDIKNDKVKKNDEREIALTVLLDIEKNDTFSSIALNKGLRSNQFEDKKVRSFVTRVVEGVTEYRLQIDYVIDRYSKTKVKKMKPLIRCVMRMAVYQMFYMDSVPDNASINEAVNMAKRHNFASLSGFVNGVLRSISREKDSIVKHLSDEAPKWISYSVPEWLWLFLTENYGDEKAEKILSAQYIDRGTSIRCNTNKTSVNELMAKISEAGITVRKSDLCEDGLIIDNYDFIRKIPGFRQGEFSVQDESSMCAIHDLGIKEGDLVVDVCAAPGGKTLYAAELLHGTGKVISRDVSEDKVELIRENAERLSAENVEIEIKDATIKDEELALKADVVICDVPCSGLGIFGRKNDIKYKMDPDKMKDLKELGYSILLNAATYVKKGGTLLYSTCTINPEENEKNVERFLQDNSEFEKVKEKLFLQGIDQCDGFFYAIMKKN